MPAAGSLLTWEPSAGRPTAAPAEAVTTRVVAMAARVARVRCRAFTAHSLGEGYTCPTRTLGLRVPSWRARRGPRGFRVIGRGTVPTMRAPIELDLHLPNFNYPGVAADEVFAKLVGIVTTA